jgi:hypothetical protein
MVKKLWARVKAFKGCMELPSRFFLCEVCTKTLADITRQGKKVETTKEVVSAKDVRYDARAYLLSQIPTDFFGRAVSKPIAIGTIDMTTEDSE